MLELLRGIYHVESDLRTLRELARSCEVVSKDLRPLINPIKALYRSWDIACAGAQLYIWRYRQRWLQKIQEAGARRGPQSESLNTRPPISGLSCSLRSHSYSHPKGIHAETPVYVGKSASINILECIHAVNRRLALLTVAFLLPLSTLVITKEYRPS